MIWVLTSYSYFVLDHVEENEIAPAGSDQWPDIEIVRKMNFDLSVHDPKYVLMSPVYTEQLQKIKQGEGTLNYSFFFLPRFSEILLEYFNK